MLFNAPIYMFGWYRFKCEYLLRSSEVGPPKIPNFPVSNIAAGRLLEAAAREPLTTHQSQSSVALLLKIKEITGLLGKEKRTRCAGRIRQ